LLDAPLYTALILGDLGPFVVKHRQILSEHLSMMTIAMVVPASVLLTIWQPLTPVVGLA